MHWYERLISDASREEQRKLLLLSLLLIGGNAWSERLAKIKCRELIPIGGSR
jgi:hypothetical protein